MPSGSTLTKADSGISITTGAGRATPPASTSPAPASGRSCSVTSRTARARKRLFLVTLGLYLVATVLTATSQDAWMFFVFRFLTGMGIGGEYAAINSAIDELIPARVRGTVDLLVNGSYWLGTAAVPPRPWFCSIPKILAVDLGWRVCFFMGAVLGLGDPARPAQPAREPPLALHPRPGGRGRAGRRATSSGRCGSRPARNWRSPGSRSRSSSGRRVGFFEVAKVVFGQYPRRSVLGLSLFVGQAFLYNAVFFTYALVLTTFYKVSRRHRSATT